MLVQGQRPRELRWYHAGAMLFGDWGTSRLYVLGLCFAFNQFASIWYMLAMSALLLGVGWAYQVICRLYPEGGGVYSAARHRSPLLGMIGGLLLCADYVVTAAISALDALHYIDLPMPHLWAAVAIAAIGVLNYFGPRKSGTAALAVALFTVVLTLMIAIAAVPSLRYARITAALGGPTEWWTQFTMIILALSGVEAVGNMTGIMVQPVDKTSRKAILPVMIEIVVLNIIMTLAMQAVPLEVLGDGNAANAALAHRDDMMKLLATYYIGPVFATVASFVFALLLLSAVNTAITDLVSIQYMMSRDKELPAFFAGLNRWGMPTISLVLATVVPFVVLLLVPDVAHLADLYAIGVIGAIAVNLATTSTNYKISMSRVERFGMMGLAILMTGTWFTIAWGKPNALLFAVSILGAGLLARWIAQHRRTIGQWMRAPVATYRDCAGSDIVPVPSMTKAIPTTATVERRLIMVATQSNNAVLQFALEEARQRRTALLVLFVRQVAVITPASPQPLDSQDDPEAVSFFAAIMPLASAAGIPLECRYYETHDVADAILDVVNRETIDFLILGASNRGTLWRSMKGDIIQKVAHHLPAKTNLLIHA